ncbi:MAG: polymer-forming cytoskeletal protein [Bacteroidota bacterium]|jgi:cytoskeletal protein CcmA (bactofilin family)
MQKQSRNRLQYLFLKSNVFYDEVHGYALPSILFLITILSVVILSILALQYFQRQNIQTAAAKVKTDYAAQSGISKIFSELKSKSDLPLIGQVIERSYDLADGEKASVTIEWWGFYLYVRSIGSFRRTNETRFALVGQTPTERFKNSLVFSNKSHQLVLTGSTHIKGDVMVGPAGVSIGTLSNYPTPRIIPIEGKVIRDPEIDIYDFDLTKQYDYYDALLGGRIPQDVEQTGVQYFQAKSLLHISSGIIKPETKYIFVQGDAIVDSALIRRENPLSIVIDGEVTFGTDVHIDGIVCIASSQSIRIPRTSHIDGSILYSRKEIIVESDAIFTAQIIAPSILIETGAKMLYPSALISYIKKDNNEQQKGINIKNGGEVEGTIIAGTEDKTNNSVFLNIESAAKISGFIISNTPITLDGSVDGCVQTKDFYFYESPTTYLGWLRSARIDREALPKSALMTVGTDSLSQLQVLDWL